MRSGKKVKVPHNLLSFLQEEDNFFIATHINPEGDALGSSLALSMVLESIGKQTTLYDKDPVPKFYKYLPGYEKFTQEAPLHTTVNLPLILLDCNTLDRAGLEGLNFRYAAVIDHHKTEDDFGDIRWVKPEAAATGVMIFYLIKELGIELTRGIAINLYSAIAIDTGTFRYNSTTAEVLRIGAELIEAGANPAYIAQSLYESWSEERFALLIMTLNTLEIRDSVAITFVTREMFKKTGTGPEDTENFPGFPRTMKDIKISAFFREIDNNYWKVSLRSRGDIDVARVAVLFRGGGHKNAAGCKITGSLESAKESLLKAISQ